MIRPTTQAWAYPWVLLLMGIALTIAVLPTPLWSTYATSWHLSPLTTISVFAVYAVGALAAVLTSGRVSDGIGRKPLLVLAMAGLIGGLVLFLFAHGVVALVIARSLHGASVGIVIVVGTATLLDLRPADGARSGLLSGVVFNVGNAVAVVGGGLLAQYAPHPLRTPYAVVVLFCLVAAPGLLFLKEPLQQRTSGRLLVVKPAVPPSIRREFWFAALGIVTSWSVMAVQMSLYPALVARHTGTTNLAVAGAVIGTTVIASAIAQLATARMSAIRIAVVGDIGMAIAITLANPVLHSRHWPAIFALAAFVGITFGLASGGSMRYLSAIVPADHRGETMSAYYVLAYLSMGVPVMLAGWAATRWELPSVFSFFAAAVAFGCLVAAVVGVVVSRMPPSAAESDTPRDRTLRSPSGTGS